MNKQIRSKKMFSLPVNSLTRGSWAYPLVRALLLKVGLLLFMTLLTTSCYIKGSTEDGSPALLASLAFSATNIMIDNGNDFIWRDVTIRMNELYTYTTDLMPRGVTSIALSEFHTEDGSIFDARKISPHQLTIEVKSGFEGRPLFFKW